MISSFLSGTRTTHWFRSLVTEPFQRLTPLLCIGAALADIALYLGHMPLPGALLLLNLLALASVWLTRRQAGQVISMKPQELASRMLQVQEHERHRLSRDLHDDIGQMLTAARLQLDWLQRRLPDELHGHGEQLGQTLEQTLAQVRDLSAILNPRQLSSLGLEASLRAHLMNTLGDSQVRWTLECHQQLHGIAEEVAMAVFRVTQEAVTNLLRHAQAHNLLVRLQRLPEGLALLIRDDGTGFEPLADPAGAGQRGLCGMRERVTLLGGRWKLSSVPGQGTCIEALFPWAPRSHERAHGYKACP